MHIYSPGIISNSFCLFNWRSKYVKIERCRGIEKSPKLKESTYLFLNKTSMRKNFVFQEKNVATIENRYISEGKF